jgi:hypothetical protein
MRHDAPMADIQSLCVVVGFARGHGRRVRVFLDAHEEIVLGELAVVQPTGRVAFESQEQLRTALIDSSRTSYLTRDPNAVTLHHGYCAGPSDDMRVLGTGNGQALPAAWRANPDVIAQLAEVAGAAVKLINVVRNPWDHIAETGEEPPIPKLFARAKTIDDIRASGVPVHDLALEDLAADPRAEMSDVLAFLNVEASDDYLELVDLLADVELPRSGAERAWTKQQVRAIRKRLPTVSWMQRYPAHPRG